jgi:hypothetical protein
MIGAAMVTEIEVIGGCPMTRTEGCMLQRAPLRMPHGLPAPDLTRARPVQLTFCPAQVHVCLLRACTTRLRLTKNGLSAGTTWLAS